MAGFGFHEDRSTAEDVREIGSDDHRLILILGGILTPAAEQSLQRSHAHVDEIHPDFEGCQSDTFYEF